MSTLDSMQEVCRKLTEYAKLEGSEVGETCTALLSLWNHYRDYLTPSCSIMIEREIRRQLKDFMRKSKIVTKSETRTESWQELEWLQ